MTTDLNPNDVTTEQLTDRLEGRPIQYNRDQHCARCDQKNSLRRKYADPDQEDLEDESFEEGERILFTAVYEDQPFMRGVPFAVRGLYHERHPQLPREEAVQKGVALVRGSATLKRAEEALVVNYAADDENGHEDDLLLTDVTTEFYSPPEEGPDRTPEPREETVVADGIGDRPDWPDAENEWRKALIRDAEKAGE